jgi:hypothetical protein
VAHQGSLKKEVRNPFFESGPALAREVVSIPIRAPLRVIFADRSGITEELETLIDRLFKHDPAVLVELENALK